ncbi:MAG: CRTAC1 family protein [Phycisphaerae bacterium]
MRHTLRSVAAATLFWIALPIAAGADRPLFKLRLHVPGIDYRNICGSPAQLPILEQNGQGIGIIDYDGDGLVDLFVPNGSTESRWRTKRNPGCRLYRNVGGWRFVDVTEQAGVGGNAWSCGVAVADYDADGDFDIYVLNWGPNVLYRNNGDGTFTDVTGSAGVGDARWSSSAAFADFDGDGMLDIYVSNYVHFDYDDYPTKESDGRPCLYRGIETGCGPWCYEGQRDTLYINVGNGRFEDRSTESGLAATRGFRGFGVIGADLDADGDADVYVGCDVMPNLYLSNTGKGPGATGGPPCSAATRQGSALPARAVRFASVGPQQGGAYNAAGAHESGMGVAAADFDRSGTLDLFTTNFAGEKNTFYRNQGGMLLDDSSAVGFDRHRTEMGWGVCVQDFNQDGLVDVFVANGQIYPQVARLNDPADRYAQPPRLYLQKRSKVKGPRSKVRRWGPSTLDLGPWTSARGRLEEVETEEAFSSSFCGVARDTKRVSFCLRGCAAADLDNDGDVDIVAVQHNGPLVFFENLSDRPSVLLELAEAGGGRSPIGARVVVRGDVLVRESFLASTHWLLPNQGYQSSIDHRLHIALPPGVTTLELEVFWPNGRRERYSINPSPKRQRWESATVVRLRQGAGESPLRADKPTDSNPWVSPVAPIPPPKPVGE